MPEIKHNFTKGKMNKDLDERLVPKGEYRHAENIQVSSSDSGNVGSLQNLMGNKNATMHIFNSSWSTFHLPSSSKCIGAISDEKNNTLYWFITSPTCDGIIRRKIYEDEAAGSVFPHGECEWVFADANKNTLKFPQNKTITGINIIDDLLFWTDNVNEPRKINITKCVDNTSGFQNQTQLVTETGDIDMIEEHITVIKKSPTNALSLELKTSRLQNQTAEGSGFPLSYTAIAKITDDATQLDDDIIEVIPVVDPTAPFNPNTFSNVGIGDKVKIQLLQDIIENSDFELEWINGVNGGGGSNATGDAPWAGQKIVLKEYSLAGKAPALPITDYRIKGVLTNWYNVDNPSLISDSSLQTANDDAGKIIIEFEVTNINGTPPAAKQDNELKYAVDLFDESEKLFEFKFPRFSYRYKYQDNEYSTFAPWTEVAFVPGSFDYHPKKGYNIGMTNRLSSCIIKGFKPQDIPLDVKEIDVLYKEEGSTTIYVVESIKKEEFKTINITGVDYNNWQLNYYEVKDETINKILPENQFLRPWDNVPITALAQEITGNRVVYGNYTQGYDVKVNAWDNGPVEQSYFPIINTSIVQALPNLSYAIKSIKSLREYQLGVLLVDKYGRETPILTNSNSTFKLEKDKAATANRLKVSLTNAVSLTDEELLYYKFFIKETSGEYYNLAMDRWYDAGDGNKWLSFPSSDRNKVDIDTFLILKKAQESNDLIVEPARYKILAIENEAPDFIKIDKRLTATAVHTTANEVFYAGTSNNPFFTEQNLTLKYEPFNNSSGSSLHEIKDGELWIDFGIVGSTLKSSKYRVSKITKTGTSNDENYNIILNEPLGHDVDFIADDPTLQNISGVATNATIRFFNYKVENKAKYDGRFFVKVFGDDTFKKSFEAESISSTTLYRVADEKIQYSLFPNHNDLHSVDATGQNYGTDGYVAGLGRWASFFRNYNKKDSDHCWFDIYQSNSNGEACDDANSPLVGRFAFEHAAYPGISGYDSTAPMTKNYSGSLEFPGWWKEALRQTLHEDSSSVNTTNQDEWFIYQKYGSSLSAGATGSGGSTNPGEWDYYRHIPNEVWVIDGGPFDGKQSGPDLLWDIDSTTSGTNDGITVWGSSWSMDLALGPIAPSNHANPHSNAGNSTNNFWGRDDQNNFWNIGTQNNANTQYADLATQQWIKNYEVGMQWKWEGDPNSVVYTITQKNEWGTANYDRTREVGFDPIFSLSINKRKNWEFHMEPAATWIPYDGTFGPIANGHQLDINAELGPSSTTSDNSAVGVLEDYCIYLETNSATCNNTGQEGVVIKAGMIVTQYNNAGTALTHAATDDAAPVLQVKEVTKTSNYTKVILCGYVNALDETHCITPTDGQLVRFEQGKCNGYSPSSANRISLNKSNDESENLLKAVGYSMQFVEAAEFDNTLPDNPAIWETEPKDQSDLDIYYEISGYNPWILNPETIKTSIPVGSDVELVWGPQNTVLTPCKVVSTDYSRDDATGLMSVIELSETTNTLTGFGSSNSILRITKPDGVSFEVYVAQTVTAGWGDTTSDGDGTQGSSTNWEYLVEISNNTPSNYILNWHNCYSFLNGVESNRIRDNFNLPFIKNGVKVSAKLEEEFAKEHRSNGLIYSGLYNSITGANNLNQFITAEKITKDINPIYGSIQKLHSRDTDLIALCEDKILKILANKDAIFNADGNPNLTATENVLGQTIPFVGEYGISKNPESFASESYRAYFTDKQRGAVLRLSRDGLTPISDHGMKSWFRDNLKLSNYSGDIDGKLIGSYDDKKDEYNLAVKGNHINQVVTFREDVKGWVSFKSFVNMEHGISSNNEYYTFFNGKLYKHHEPTSTYNNFYGNPYNSSVRLILNDFPGSVKSFKTINYEGSKSKITQIAPGVPGAFDLFNQAITPPSAEGWHDNLHYNETASDGWHVSSTHTDLEHGAINEFIEKEGKYFNYIKGTNGLTHNSDWVVDLDTNSGNIEGLGRFTGSSASFSVYGCMDANAFNYNSSATINETSNIDSSDPCEAISMGCIDPLAFNYNSLANTDLGNCLYPGCMDDGIISLEMEGSGVQLLPNDFSPYPGIAANNIDPGANIQCGPTSDVPYSGYGFPAINGCCTYTFNGCTDPTAFNYDSIATIDDGTCIPFIYGCLDQNADNYNSYANTSSFAIGTGTGPCIYGGCIDPNADNYITPNPSQINLGNGWSNLESYTGAPHGDILALAGMPSYIGSTYGTLDNPFIGTTYGCSDWSFAPTIFGSNGQNPPPVGIGVLIPRMQENGTCSSVPWVDASWDQYANGCDPTVPYEPIIYIGANGVNTGGTAYDPGPFGNNPPNSPDGGGGVLPTWPDIDYALDINGHTIDFTHKWWNVDSTYNNLYHLVNPFPPCANEDDGSCDFIGCADVYAANYTVGVTIANNDSCLYCGDSTGLNYDQAVNGDGSDYLDGCIYCPASNQFTIDNVISIYNAGGNAYDYNPTGSQIQVDFFLSTIANTGSVFIPSPSATINNPEDYWVAPYYRLSNIANSGTTPIPGSWTQISGGSTMFYADLTLSTNGYNGIYTVVGLTPDTDYDIKFVVTCFDPDMFVGTSTTTITKPALTTITTESGPTTGCLDPSAVNYCLTCTVDDNSCNYDGCTIEADMLYIGGTIPCNSPDDGNGNNLVWLGQSEEWDTNIQAIAETDPQYPNNWSSPLGMWIMQNGPFESLPNSCCLFQDVNTDELVFDGIAGAAGYYGCMDPAANNYCAGCTYDIYDEIGVAWCEFGGCNYNPGGAFGPNPDVNGYCADAVYDHLLQTYTFNGALGQLSMPNNGACDIGNGQFGYLPLDFDPKVNNHHMNTVDCAFEGCTEPGCDIGYNWPDQQPTGDQTCDYNTSSGSLQLPMNMGGTAAPNALAINTTINGVASGLGAGYLVGLNNYNFFPVGYNNSNTNSSVDSSNDNYGNAGWMSIPNPTGNIIWSNYNMSVMCYDSVTCVNYKSACQNLNNLLGTPCEDACYTLAGNNAPYLAGTAGGRDIPFNFEPIGCTAGVGPQKSALDGQDFTGAYHKFEYNIGESWCDPTLIGAGDAINCDPGASPMPASFSTVDVLPVASLGVTNNPGMVSVKLQKWPGDSQEAYFLYDGAGTLLTPETAYTNNVWGGKARFFAAGMAASHPAAGTTVKWGVYKMCQNGEEVQINQGYKMINNNGNIW